jgi:hypothetical protein
LAQSSPLPSITPEHSMLTIRRKGGLRSLLCERCSTIRAEQGIFSNLSTAFWTIRHQDTQLNGYFLHFYSYLVICICRYVSNLIIL